MTCARIGVTTHLVGLGPGPGELAGPDLEQLGPAVDLDLDPGSCAGSESTFRSELGPMACVTRRSRRCSTYVIADVRAPVFQPVPDIRTLTVYNDNRQDLGSKMTPLVAANL